MLQTKLVHFTVAADFATKFPRDLWAEGEYRKALDVISSCGVDSISFAHDVIMGRKKFIETGKPNEFTWAADNWRPDLSMCHLGQYPDPASGAEMLEAEKRLFTNRMEKEMGRYWYEMAEDRDYADLYGRARRAVTGAVLSWKAIINVDEYMARVKEQDKVAVSKPQPGHLEKEANGIIAPDGTYYACGYWMHDATCAALGYSGREEAKQAGYIILRWKVGVIWCDYDISDDEPYALHLTKAQKKTLSAWAKLYDVGNEVFNLLKDSKVKP